MLSDEIKELGSGLVSDLDRHQASPADKWMSHYLAEQMELSEKARTKKERQAAAERCAELIPKLWDKRVETVSHHMRSRISDLLRLRPERSEWSDGLASLIKDGFTKKRRPPRRWDNRVEILWELVRVEEMLILLLALSTAIGEESDQNAAEEAGQQLKKNEKLFSQILRTLALLFPTAERLKSGRSNQVSRFSKEALLRIHALRTKLF